jgi:hypothetical protein
LTPRYRIKFWFKFNWRFHIRTTSNKPIECRCFKKSHQRPTQNYSRKQFWNWIRFSTGQSKNANNIAGDVSIDYQLTKDEDTK